MLAGSEKHVVLCATTLRATMLIDFLNEFYADVRLQVCMIVYFLPFICLISFRTYRVEPGQNLSGTADALHVAAIDV